VTAPALLEADGRVALVTGAAGGIGRATVELFRAAGARVVAFDSDATRLSARGDQLLPVAGDATREEDVRGAVASAVSQFGRLDFAIGTVGLTGRGALADTPLEEWRRLMDINLTSAFLLARESHQALVRPGGVLVLIASVHSRNGGGRLSGAPYAIAKSGIANLVRHLAKDWAPEGLRVNCVMPGPVATPMLDRLSAEEHEALKDTIPLKRYAQAEEIAAAIAYLCSKHAVSMTGACINVSGGLVLDQ